MGCVPIFNSISPFYYFPGVPWTGIFVGYIGSNFLTAGGDGSGDAVGGGSGDAVGGGSGEAMGGGSGDVVGGGKGGAEVFS